MKCEGGERSPPFFSTSLPPGRVARRGRVGPFLRESSASDTPPLIRAHEARKTMRVLPQYAHNLRRCRNDSVDARLMRHLRQPRRHSPMNSIIYIVGLIVIVMAILSFIGLA